MPSDMLGGLWNVGMFVLSPHAVKRIPRHSASGSPFSTLPANPPFLHALASDLSTATRRWLQYDFSRPTLSWRRILLLTSAFLVLLLGTTWFVLQKTDATTALVRRELAKALATGFVLQHAEIDIANGVLTLEGLQLRDPVQPSRDLLRCDRVRLAIDANPLGELLAVHSIEIDGLELWLDLSRRLPSLPELLRQHDGPGASPDRLPPLRVDAAQVHLRVADDVPALEFCDIALHAMPQRDDLRAVLLQGSVACKNMQVPLQLTGVGDPAAGSCRITASAQDARIDAAMFARLQPFVPFQLPTTGVAGDLQKLQLWFELHPASDSAEDTGANFGFAAELEHVECTLPELPYPLRDGAVQLSGSTQRGGSARLRLHQQTAAGDIDVRASATGLLTTPHFEVRGSTLDTAIDADVLTALGAFQVGRNIVAALDPTSGRADVEIYLRDPGLDDELVEVDVHVRDARLRYLGFGHDRRIGFPLPLRAVDGTVRVRGKLIQLLDVGAEFAPEAGGGAVRCSGRIVTGSAERDVVEIDVDADAVQFTPELRLALQYLLPTGGKLYDQFTPSGEAAVSVRVRTADVETGTWQVRVQPRQIRAAYAVFPYPVLLDGGQVLARDHGIEVDLQGRCAGDAKVALQGRLLPGQSGSLGDGSLELRVSATGAPIDQALRTAATALLPEVAPFWDTLSPSGFADCELVVWHSANDREPRYDLRMDVRDALLRPQPLDLLIENVHGTIYAAGQGHDHHIDVDALRGNVTTAPGSPPANIAVVGTMAKNRPIGADFTAVVRDLHLDQTLASALDRVGVIERTTWDVLRPSGLADCVLHWQRATPTSEPQEQMTVHLRDVRSDAAMLPQAATGVTGDLEVRDRKVEFKDLRANIGNARVDCHQGHVRTADDGHKTEVSFVVSCDDFPLNDDVSRLFEGPLKRTVLERQFRGAVAVQELELTFLIPPTGSDGGFETFVSGTFGAKDVSMLAGTRIEGIQGTIRLDRSHVSDTEGTLTGSISRGSFRLFRHPCIDLQTRFLAAPDHIELSELGFNLHNGRVRSRSPGAVALRYSYPLPNQTDGDLSLSLTWDGVSLSDLLQQSGWTGYHFHGSLLGEVDVMQLHGADFAGMLAAGHVAAVDADLGTVPLFTAIYAQLSEDNRPRFESGNLLFIIADGKIDFDRLELRSPMLSVTGDGSLRMDGYLDVTLLLDNLFGNSADYLIVPAIVKNLAQRLVRFHLFGYLRDLHAEQRWFTERKPRHTGLGPVPPRLEKPKRPDF